MTQRGREVDFVDDVFEPSTGAAAVHPTNLIILITIIIIMISIIFNTQGTPRVKPAGRIW